MRKIKNLKVCGKAISLYKDDINDCYVAAYDDNIVTFNPGNYDYLRELYKLLDERFVQLGDKCLKDTITDSELEELVDYNKIFKDEYRYKPVNKNVRCRYKALDKINKMMCIVGGKANRPIWLFGSTSSHHEMENYILRTVALLKTK